MYRRRLFAFLGSIALTRPAKAVVDAAPPHAEPLTLSAETWRKRLTAAQFEVLRNHGTERPHTSTLNAEKRTGNYHCAGCDAPLFASHAKYDSGTGWPSFFQPLPGAVLTRTDFKMILPRSEYHCARCKGHQGHVFSDGPAPTGKRYCNNGIALSFRGAA